MADTTYKRLDKDQLIFLVQYLFTKLKNSPLADKTEVTDDLIQNSQKALTSGGMYAYDQNLQQQVSQMLQNLNQAISSKATIDDVSLLIGNATSTKADTVELEAHTGNTSNPHGVTAAQIGLGNVNNTSDENKPISTATQTALDAKANTEDIPTKLSQLINDIGAGGGSGTLPNNISIQYVENNSHKCIAFDILG